MVTSDQQTREPDGRTNGLAIASFVLGLIAFVPFAVMFAIVALIDMRRLRQRGQGLAVAGLALSAVWSVVAALAIGVAIGNATGHAQDVAGPAPAATAPGRSLPPFTVVTPRPSPAFTPPVETPLSALKVGDCLAPPEPNNTSTVQVDMCSGLHQAQVFAIVRVPVGGQSMATVSAEGQSDCMKAVYSIYHDPVRLPAAGPTLYYLAPQAAGSAYQRATCAMVFGEWGQAPLPAPEPASSYTAVQKRFLAMEEAARVPAKVFQNLNGRPPWRTDQLYSLRAAAADRAEAAWLRGAGLASTAAADAEVLAKDDLAEATWWDRFNAARNAADFANWMGQADPVQQLDADIAQLRSDLGLPT